MLRVCLRCNELRQHKCRGLCGGCLTVARRAGELYKYPTTRKPTRSLADTAEDYEILARRGMSEEQLAAALGYANAHVLEVTIRKAKRKGLL